MCRCCCARTNCGTSSPTDSGATSTGSPAACSSARRTASPSRAAGAAAEQWGLPHEMLDAAEIRRRFPTFTPQRDDVALYEAKAGFARPEMTVQAHIDLADAARRPAALRRAGARVEAMPGGAGVQVTTARRHLHRRPSRDLPRRVGAAAARRLRHSDHVERQVLYWFEPAGGTAPSSTHPIFIHEDAAGMQIYGFPAIDGPERRRQGGVLPARASSCTPETIDRDVHDSEIAEMRGACRRVLPVPRRAVPALGDVHVLQHARRALRHRAATRTMRSVTVACGFSGHGFKFVPVVG